MQKPYLFSKNFKILKDKSASLFKSKCNAKSKACLNKKGLPGNTILVGADKISSPTTESDRIGVYLGKQDKNVNTNMI